MSGARHTVCRFCALDIEGISPYRRGEWRDRGNNSTCSTGEKHAPVTARDPGVVARVNATLREEGIAERVRRARGYFQMYGGRAERCRESGIYGCGYDYHALLHAVRVKLEEAYAV